MTIGLKKNNICTDYTMMGETLAQVNEHKYLGITISDNMTWDASYRNMVNKANRILGLLQRNVHNCSQSTKAKAYKALVRPHLEYAAAVIDPHQTNHIQMLDRVQRRAARFVVNDFRRTSSVTKMLNDLQWEPLSDRRQTARLCQFYQIHHGTSPVTSSKLQARNAKFSSRRYTVDAYKQIETRTVRFQNSFFPEQLSIGINCP